MLIWGGGIVVYMLSKGELPDPVTAYDWGSVTAFGLGVLLAATGVVRLVGSSMSWWIVLVASLALTATAVAVRKQGDQPTPHQCKEALDHWRSVAAAESSPDYLARFDRNRKKTHKRCRTASMATLRCVLDSTTMEEIHVCQ
jgi:hypothetical protein